MTSQPPSEPTDANRPKRATVASVDRKVDEVLEEVEGLRIEMSQIKSALKELAQILAGESPNDDDPNANNQLNSMYG